MSEIAFLYTSRGRSLHIEHYAWLWEHLMLHAERIQASEIVVLRACQPGEVVRCSLSESIDCVWFT